MKKNLLIAWLLGFLLMAFYPGDVWISYYFARNKVLAHITHYVRPDDNILLGRLRPLGKVRTALYLANPGGMVQVPTHYRETISNTTDIGSATKGVVLLCDSDVIFTIANNNAATAVFNVHNASGVIGTNVGSVGSGRTNGCSFVVQTGAAFKTIFDTPEGLAGQGGQGYATLRNIFITGNASSTCTEMVNWEGVFDLNDLSNVHVDTFPCIGVRVASNASNSVGPVLLQNLEVNGTYVGGARPLLVDINTGALSGLVINGGLYVHPGTGLSAIEINGNGSATAAKGVTINGTFIENLQNNNASKLLKLVDVHDVTISALSILAEPTDKGVDINQSGAGRTCSIRANVDISSSGNAAPAIVNEITTTSLGGVNVSGYQYLGDSTCSFQNITIENGRLNLKDASGNTIFDFPVSNGSPIFANHADATQSLTLNSGSTATQIGALVLQDRGTNEWQVQKDASNNLNITDLVHSKVRIGINQSSTGLTLDGQTSTLQMGTGAPAGPCTNGSVFIRSDAVSASTVLYVCQPANTWTAVTVP